MPDLAEARVTARAAMVILAATVLRLTWLARDPYPLYVDEAQYWTWAQSFDWGYFSKPPLIAWLIATTTAMVGDNELGVRIAAPIAHALIALLIADLGRRLFDARTGAWAGVVWISLPAVSLSSTLMSTDVPLLLFWAAALACLVRALDGDRRWWTGVGVALGLGLLSKYAMAFFVLAAGLYLVRSDRHRAQLRTRWPWLALALGLAIYSPNLIWNVANGWISYRHTGDNANLTGDLFRPAKLAEFVLGQLGVFGPILFVLLALGVVLRWRTLREDDRIWLLTAFTLPPLVLISIEALLSRANANWAATAYVAATLLVTRWCMTERRWRRLLPVSLALHAVVALVMYGYHDLARAAGIELTRSRLAVSLSPPSVTLPDPYNRLRGWNYLGNAVATALAQSPGHALMVDDRQLFAELAFYVRPRPQQVMWNPRGQVAPQYDIGANAVRYAATPILYLTENPDPQDVLSRFNEAQLVSRITIPLYKDYQRRYVLFALKGYRG